MPAKPTYEELEKVVQGVHKYSLVIESAVRWEEGEKGPNYEPILGLVMEAQRLTPVNLYPTRRSE